MAVLGTVAVTSKSTTLIHAIDDSISLTIRSIEDESKVALVFTRNGGLGMTLSPIEFSHSTGQSP